MRRLGLSAALVILLWVGFDRWIATAELPALVPETSAQVYDRNGALLSAFVTSKGFWRFAPDATSPLYGAMLIAYEDKRFYQHNGVDLRAMARALRDFVLSGQVSSGGSTITMQVARLLENLPTGSMPAKLRQIRLAWALERQLDKEQILDLYFTLAPFGGNVEGVAAASYAYLGKSPARLTPAEAALLVSIPQSPVARRPDKNMARAIAARNKVLERVAEAGVIDQDALRAAKSERPPDALRPIPRRALHLASQLKGQRLSLDARWQISVEGLLHDAVRSLDPSVSGAVIVAEIATGKIRAYAGSPDYISQSRRGYIDMAAAIRSPGSTLKPFIYAQAFSDGIARPETLINDLPKHFGSYAPENFDGLYQGSMSISQALRASRNVPAIAVLDRIGPERFLSLLQKAGATPRLPDKAAAELAVGLGGLGLSLRDLTTLYAGLANGGTMRRLTVLHDAPDASAPGRFLSKEAARETVDILRNMVVPYSQLRAGVAFKTGTSYGNRDTLAIGFDGRHVVGVMLGRADNAPMPGLLGADTAAPLMLAVFDRIGVTPFQTPITPEMALTSLPVHLQTFGDLTRPAEFEILYPPQNARISTSQAILPVELKGGEPPFYVFLNDKARGVFTNTRQLMLELPSAGFYKLAVIDQSGHASTRQFQAIHE